MGKMLRFLQHLPYSSLVYYFVCLPQKTSPRVHGQLQWLMFNVYQFPPMISFSTLIEKSVKDGQTNGVTLLELLITAKTSTNLWNISVFPPISIPADKMTNAKESTSRSFSIVSDSEDWMQEYLYWQACGPKLVRVNNYEQFVKDTKLW